TPGGPVVKDKDKDKDYVPLYTPEQIQDFMDRQYRADRWVRRLWMIVMWTAILGFVLAILFVLAVLVLGTLANSLMTR
ncbi:MAG: hypothetical protein ACOCXX_04260, partial [Planctomycetota bacterium]